MLLRCYHGSLSLSPGNSILEVLCVQGTNAHALVQPPSQPSHSALCTGLLWRQERLWVSPAPHRLVLNLRQAANMQVVIEKRLNHASLASFWDHHVQVGGLGLPCIEHQETPRNANLMANCRTRCIIIACRDVPSSLLLASWRWQPPVAIPAMPCTLPRNKTC